MRAALLPLVIALLVVVPSQSAAQIGYGVTVTPDGDDTPQRTPFTNGYTAVFNVKNTGSQPDTYLLSCWGSENISCTNLSHTEVTLGPNASVNVTATYNTGAAGAGYLQMSAESNFSVDVGQWDIQVGDPPPPPPPPPAPTIAVTPDDSAVSRDSYLHYAQTFRLTHTSGSTGITLSLTPACTGPGVLPTNCVVSPATVALSPTQSATATVSYSSGPNGTTGRVTLRALESGTQIVKDSGWIRVSVGSTSGTQQAPQVSVIGVNAGTTVERDLCLAVALGSSAAAECGDLRLIHELPTLRTLSKARTPTLHYNVAHAEGYGMVAALVTMPPGALFPDSIVAVLRFGGVEKARGRWAGNEWTAGRPRRIVLRTTDTLSTGAYAYTIEVASWYGSAWLAGPAALGELVVVNRRRSPLGAGWWLAGLERLHTASMLWVGGDGSARVYQPTGIPDVWAAATVDRPDTLKKVGTEYVRLLPGKLEVWFNAEGRHVRTRNRLGHVTRFNYPGGDTLKSITLPVADTSLATQRYRFTYTSAAVTVSDSLGAMPRTTTIGLLADGRVAWIDDPDTSRVAFGYAGTNPRVTSRSDRRGAVRAFVYDGGGKVQETSISPSAGAAPIVTRLRGLEAQGLPQSGTPSSVDAALAYTRLDGPRGDVGDSTLFWLDRFGGPNRILNALGQITQLERTKPGWPGLVTKTISPNGRVVTATYDPRGHVASVTDSSAVVRGQPAAVTTSYQWHQTCDMVTRVTPPEGSGDTLHYDGNTCNRLWQQNGAGHRVSFTYHPVTQLLATMDEPGITGVDSILYDAALGNVAATRTPLGIRTLHLTDAYGRDTLVKSPIDSAQTVFHRQRVVYDRMDLVREAVTLGPATTYRLSTMSIDSVVGAKELWVYNSYDREGNLTHTYSVSEPEGSPFLAGTTDYDLAGRDTFHVSGTRSAITVYDPAGNPISVRSGRGHTITQTYDALNRVVTRIVPPVIYPRALCEGLGQECVHRFPKYPNYGDSLRFEVDTQRFAHDVMGNMIQADNGDARIKRSYHPNGWLETDSLRLRNYLGTLYDKVYGLGFRYDANGRRVVLKHPVALAPGGADSVLFIWNLQTGALREVKDIAGRRYVFTDDSAGRQTHLDVYAPGAGAPGVVEIRQYDDDGRLTRRLVQTPTASPVDVLLDSLWYDPRAKVRGARSTSAALGGPQRWQLWYSGVGALVASDFQRDLPADLRQEEFRTDALGNTTLTWTGGQPGNPRPMESAYDPSGQLTLQHAMPPGGTFPTIYPDSLSQAYDPSGNVHYRVHKRYNYNGGNGTSLHSWDPERHYYGSDEKLRVVQRVEVRYAEGATEDGVWEEYRYDALGRRVLRRINKDDLSNAGGKRSAYERYVWDGDRLLWELAGQGPEQDDGAAPKYGRVGYVHGRELDHPLALSDGRIPLATWRGAHESSVWATGQPADCTRRSQPCDNINWPAKRWSMAFRPWVSDADVVYTWRGSLIQGQQDASGMMYRRNRYYDPQTGRFTQEDPIGLAGGLNLYGFAGGDPVTFSDPFGLCPEELRSTDKCDEWNQKQAAEAVSTYNREKTRGNPGTGFVQRGLPGVRGVNGDELMLAANCGGGQEETTTGCTKVGQGGIEIVVNADKPIPAIATTLAHENVHAAGFDMSWEGYAQTAARVFVLSLPRRERLAAELAGAGPRPTHLVFPFVPLVIR